MPKAARTILITCAFLLIFGIVLTSIGAAFGGARLMNVFWSNGWHISDASEDYSYSFDSYTENWSGSFSRMNVTAEACELRFEEGSEFSISGRYDPNFWKLEYGASGDQLDVSMTVRSHSMNINFGWFDDSNHCLLVITYPHGTDFTKVDIIADAALVSIDKLTADDLYLNLDAITFNANQLETEVFTITLNAGSVDIQSLEVSKAASIDMNAGDMSVRDASVKDLDLNLDFGSFSYWGLLSGNNYIKQSAGSADFRLDQPASDLDVYYKVSAGDFSFNNSSFAGLDSSGNTGSSSARVKMDVSVDFGSLTIKTQ
ncbi:MAG: DUF4097 domain-containing protein [Coriobacteriales bacterium]|jgi:hypothetical protein|nr:DUF4097 domain-containing protein [Coriobacteriales bacterium]